MSLLVATDLGVGDGLFDIDIARAVPTAGTLKSRCFLFAFGALCEIGMPVLQVWQKFVSLGGGSRIVDWVAEPPEIVDHHGRVEHAVAGVVDPESNFDRVAGTAWGLGA